MLSNYENRSSNTLKDPIKQTYRLSNVTRFVKLYGGYACVRIQTGEVIVIAIYH